jgi:hypothetical protein
MTFCGICSFFHSENVGLRKQPFHVERISSGICFLAYSVPSRIKRKDLQVVTDNARQLSHCPFKDKITGTGVRQNTYLAVSIFRRFLIILLKYSLY